MDNNNVTVGQEVLIKTPKQGRFRFYGWDTAAARVSRVTKARIFVRREGKDFAGNDFSEQEFNKDDLTERSSRDAYHRRQLVVEPAEITKIREQQAAEKARRKLEGDGAVAFEQLAAKFSPEMLRGHRALENRTDAEIQALIAAVEALLAKVEG